MPASCLLAEFYIQPTHKGAKEIHIKKHVKRISFWLDEKDDLMKKYLSAFNAWVSPESIVGEMPGGDLLQVRGKGEQA